MSDRNEYSLHLVINQHYIQRVIIDQHYKVKHPDVTDEIILGLVSQLDGRKFDIEEEEHGFQYLSVEPVYYRKAPYRLILLLYFSDDFLGVINAFRVSR